MRKKKGQKQEDPRKEEASSASLTWICRLAEGSADKKKSGLRSREQKPSMLWCNRFLRDWDAGRGWYMTELEPGADIRLKQLCGLRPGQTWPSHLHKSVLPHDSLAETDNSSAVDPLWLLQYCLGLNNGSSVLQAAFVADMNVISLGKPCAQRFVWG